MSAEKKDRYLHIMPEGEDEVASALAQWFSVSGDMDDFIFYDETDPPCSER